MAPPKPPSPRRSAPPEPTRSERSIHLSFPLLKLLANYFNKPRSHTKASDSYDEFSSLPSIRSRLRGPAATIKQTRTSTFVSQTATGASKCFVLFAASHQKVLLPGAKIGIQSAIGGGYETPNSFAITTVMARTLASLDVPDAIVGRMIRTSPGEIAWLIPRPARPDSRGFPDAVMI